MSLRPDDSSSRSRSKSPARTRERSRSNVRAPSPGPVYSYSAGQGSDAATGTPQFEVRQPSGPAQITPGLSSYHAPQANPSYVSPSSLLGGRYQTTETRTPSAGLSSDMSNITMGGYADLPPHERPGYVQQGQGQYQYPQAQAHGQPTSPGVQYAQPLQYAQNPQSNPQWTYTQNPGVTATQQPLRTVPTTQPKQTGSIQYAAPPEKITYTAKPVVASTQPQILHNPSPQQHQQQHLPYPQSQYYVQQSSQQSEKSHHQRQPSYPEVGQQSYSREQQPPYPDERQPSHSQERQSSYLTESQASSYNGHKVIEIAPPNAGKLGAPPSPSIRPHRLSVHSQHSDLVPPPSPGLAPRMDRLSVSGNRPDMHTIVPGGLPPPSPLLEAYHGVYQSLSPMPSPMILPNNDIDDLPPLSPIHSHQRGASSSSHRRSSPSSRSRKPEKRVKIYDASEDAVALMDALAQRQPDVDVLIDILPALSHDQMMELRTEYKRHCKVQGRGINIAKHIKMKTTGNFGKICYVTALGRWESEGYWANFWYQSSSAKRELLIEALMGRTNAEMREIKDAFKDKRYADSLTKCMDKELKADKFRRAVLMALEASRQEETDQWPVEYRNKDVDTLYRALKAREGGESAILEIVVNRSDNHLRDVLRTYERKYQENFARAALRKSNNLVGEVIAHILNGVINKPARDAMLLHHALMDLIKPSDAAPSKDSKSASSSKHERQQRHELLISRVVRLHWDRLHLMRVKREYEDKYGREVEEDVEDAIKSDYRDFALQLLDVGK